VVVLYSILRHGHQFFFITRVNVVFPGGQESIFHNFHHLGCGEYRFLFHTVAIANHIIQKGDNNDMADREGRNWNRLTDTPCIV